LEKVEHKRSLWLGMGGKGGRFRETGGLIGVKGKKYEDS
jgi:hypothetical protein